MTKLRDLVGFTSYQLTVIERGPNKGKFTQWWCQCTCGTRCLVRAGHLTAQAIQSCGCHRVEQARRNFRTHGLSKTPEFRAWAEMLKRCLNPRNKRWHRYGGRGITVCERWQNSFENFLQDVGPRPTPQHSLDRYPDNDGNYEPGNVRWATTLEQARNTSWNRRITLRNETHCLAEWLEILGLKAHLYRGRRRLGWSPEQTLLTPSNTRHRKSSPS